MQKCGIQVNAMNEEYSNAVSLIDWRQKAGYRR